MTVQGEDGEYGRTDEEDGVKVQGDDGVHGRTE